MARKFVRTFAHTALALMLALPLAQLPAAAKPDSPSSFKSGFSSQRSSSPSSSRGGFGSFGKRASSSSSASSGSADAGKARGGGFGSFGRAAPADGRKSDSALSQKLDRDAAAARALRTLDERRAAQAARNAPPPRQPDNVPPPGYGNGPAYGSARGPAYGPAQPPAEARRDSGLGHIIAGAVIANAVSNAHAHRGSGNNSGNNSGGQVPAQPDPSWNGGVNSVDGTIAPAGRAAPGHARGGSVLGSVLTLAVLALLGWGAYKLIMRARRKRAADKPNYSFERN